jgi:predicted methyltransferase
MKATRSGTRNVHGHGVVLIAAAGLLLSACSRSSPQSDTAAPAAITVAIDPTADALRAAIAAPHRSEANRARDPARHPEEVLTLFEVKPSSTVIELWPFGGWYAELLAPLVREQGKYIAAIMDPEAANERELGYNATLQQIFDANPAVFGRVTTVPLSKLHTELAPGDSADVVLTFRNIHNWAWAGIEKDVFASAYRALKPGGVLGVVEHRHADPMFHPTKPGDAYVGEDWAIQMIESVGFKLEARSEVNANPKDTKDYPVWSLPPNYMQGDKDREKFTAIGESDRFTLKFRKPAT